MTGFLRPDWVPQVRPGARILVAGGSGGVGRATVDMLLQSRDVVIGAHGGSKRHPGSAPNIIHIVRRLENAADCEALVADFTKTAGGIDGLVVLAGGIGAVRHWKTLTPEEWTQEIDGALNLPFFLARAAMRAMVDQGNGGRIVLNGTESALHGGSPTAFPYAVGKRAIECLVQGLAREGAPSGVLVNGVRLGFIASGFHERWQHRTEQDMADRAALVPLKRGGDVAEAAALITFLLSDWAAFMTGQMVALTGGDWL